MVPEAQKSAPPVRAEPAGGAAESEVRAGRSWRFREFGAQYWYGSLARPAVAPESGVRVDRLLAAPVGLRVRMHAGLGCGERGAFGDSAQAVVRGIGMPAFLERAVCRPDEGVDPV